jgi:hypothetical protein
MQLSINSISNYRMAALPLDMEHTITSIRKDEIDAPPILYKYRAWEGFQKTIITKREVFMSPPSKFEDEKDCRVNRSFELTDQEFCDIYFEMIRREQPRLPLIEIRYQAIAETQHTPLKEPAFLAAQMQIEFDKLDLRLGVLSLTEFNDNEIMWNKYSEGGKGFCVGLDSKQLFDYVGGGGKVFYADELPYILPGEAPEVQTVKQVFYKEAKWEFEQEYRTRIFQLDPLRPAQRAIALRPACFREIIFGWNMPLAERQRIAGECRRSNFNVRYFQAVLIDGNIMVEPFAFN